MNAGSDRDLLLDARSRAQKLVDELQRQQAELDRPQARLTPEQLRLGRAAMQDAVTSARRTLAAIEAALVSPDEPPEPREQV